MPFRKEFPAIYMGNINRDLTKAQLTYIFETLGSFQLLTHKDGKSKGWGFLCFATEADAGRGRTYLNLARLMIRGLTLDIGNVRSWGTTDEKMANSINNFLAATDPTSAPAEIKARIAGLSHSIFVGNLPGKVNKKDLHNLFADCGEIASAFVALNNKHECLGYGFIDFHHEESVCAAVERFDGYEWRGSILRVDYGEDVNKTVEWPFLPSRSAAAPAATAAATTTSNQAPWSAVLAQRAPAAAAINNVAARPPPTAVAAIPVVPAVHALAAAPAKSSEEALDDTICLIAPNLLQVALAVNTAGGLDAGVGVGEATSRLAQSHLLRKAVKELVEKVKAEA